MKQTDITQPSETDWERLATLDDTSIDFSDIPEIMPEQFAKATVRRGLHAKSQTTQEVIQLDSDVLAWFKNQDQDYQTNINKLLRAYMNAHLGKMQMQLNPKGRIRVALTALRNL